MMPTLLIISTLASLALAQYEYLPPVDNGYPNAADVLDRPFSPAKAGASAQVPNNRPGKYGDGNGFGNSNANSNANSLAGNRFPPKTAGQNSPFNQSPVSRYPLAQSGFGSNNLFQEPNRGFGSSSYGFSRPQIPGTPNTPDRFGGSGNRGPGAPTTPSPGTYPTNQSPGSYSTTPSSGTYPTNQSPGAYPINPSTGSYPTNPSPGSYSSTPSPGAYTTNQSPGTYPQNQLPGSYPSTPSPSVYSTLPSYGTNTNSQTPFRGPNNGFGSSSNRFTGQQTPVTFNDPVRFGGGGNKGTSTQNTPFPGGYPTTPSPGTYPTTPFSGTYPSTTSNSQGSSYGDNNNNPFTSPQEQFSNSKAFASANAGSGAGINPFGPPANRFPSASLNALRDAYGQNNNRFSSLGDQFTSSKSSSSASSESGTGVNPYGPPSNRFPNYYSSSSSNASSNSFSGSNNRFNSPGSQFTNSKVSAPENPQSESNRFQGSYSSSSSNANSESFSGSNNRFNSPGSQFTSSKASASANSQSESGVRNANPFGRPGAGNRSGKEDFDDPDYAFRYNVLDPESGNDFGHEESRKGEKTKGSYRVRMPDGRQQLVEYESDEDGFRPRVKYV